MVVFDLADLDEVGGATPATGGRDLVEIGRDTPAAGGRDCQ